MTCGVITSLCAPGNCDSFAWGLAFDGQRDGGLLGASGVSSPLDAVMAEMRALPRCLMSGTRPRAPGKAMFHNLWQNHSLCAELGRRAGLPTVATRDPP